MRPANAIEKDQAGVEVWRRLRPHLELPGRGLVALSGGADSSVLLAALVRAGQEIIAATFVSCLHPPAEAELARELCRRLGVEHLVLEEDPLADENFRANPPQRCYLCKKRRLAAVSARAASLGAAVIVEGVLASDHQAYRPGLRASREAGSVHPLALAGLDKAAVWDLGRWLGLEHWLRPASACLATRVTYDQELSRDLLAAIGRAEARLAPILGLAAGAFRVRVHGALIRLEAPPEVWPRLLEEGTRRKLSAEFEEAGFKYFTLDLAGFESGSMDRILESDVPTGS